jgi:Tol biopolymer transport system component
VAATEVIEPMVWGGAEWSPDGTTLLFATRTIATGLAPCTYPATLGEFCSSRIFTAAADGSSGAVAIGDPELDARSPAWSPDGSAIAFGGGDARDAIRLHVMRPDGSGVRQVGDAAGTGWSFVRQSWSPDGARIAAQVGQSYWDIVVIPVDGGEVARITDTPISDEVGPSYAPDGTLAWFGDRGDPCCLQVLEPGGEVFAMVGGVPVWSPDGALIASEGTQGALVVVDRDGEVVSTIAGAASPSWQRVAP